MTSVRIYLQFMVAYNFICRWLLLVVLPSVYVSGHIYVVYRTVKKTHYECILFYAFFLPFYFHARVCVCAVSVSFFDKFILWPSLYSLPFPHPFFALLHIFNIHSIALLFTTAIAPFIFLISVISWDQWDIEKDSLLPVPHDQSFTNFMM